MIGVEAATRFPLAWPSGRPRSPARQRPRFKSPAFAAARDRLMAELRRFGAAGVVLSTNVPLRRDGLPSAGQAQPDDPGVAVYFSRGGRHLAFACDRWTRVEDNLRAVADAIECIRTIERRGTGEMVDRAVAGFAALPPARTPGLYWWEDLGVDEAAPAAAVHAAYRAIAARHHPDRNPGDPAAEARFKAASAAYEMFKKVRGF